MDIYKHMRSKDVAEHCRKLGHVFNTFEMAHIIGSRYGPLLEKHKAWGELISDYPDMPFPETEFSKDCSDVHEELRKRIAHQKRLMDMFYGKEPGAVYLCPMCRCGRVVFPSFERALEEGREYPGDCDLGTDKIRITKAYTNEGGLMITADVDFDGNLYFIEAYGESDLDIVRERFDFLEIEDVFYANIPIPFKRGDILTARRSIVEDEDEAKPGEKERIVVLNWVDRFDEELLSQHAKYINTGKNDMRAYCFSANENGILHRNEILGYDRFEYRTEEPEGKDGLLPCVSSYLQKRPGGKPDCMGLSELLTMQLRIVFEKLLRDDLDITRLDSYNNYGSVTDEGLRLRKMRFD
jgi:hypothetical protein